MPKRSLDCRVATILAMTKGEVAGERGNAGGPLDCRVAALLAMTTQKHGGAKRPRDCRVGALPLLAMTTGGNLRRSGFACLAWPGSALSQGPLRSALYCRRVRHPSVRDSLTGWPVGDRGGSPGSRRCRRARSEPKRGTGVVRRDVPGTTASDAGGACGRADRISHRTCRVRCRVPVRRPLTTRCRACRKKPHGFAAYWPTSRVWPIPL